MFVYFFIFYYNILLYYCVVVLLFVSLLSYNTRSCGCSKGLRAPGRTFQLARNSENTESLEMEFIASSSASSSEAEEGEARAAVDDKKGVIDDVRVFLQ